MCPPALVPSPANIGLYWTDEEVFMSLERMIRGSSIPENVIADANPYQHMPSNLPDDIWYFIRSEQKKDSEHGFWSTKGSACEIFMNSSITGWRTTLEFHEGRAPHGQRTNWVMQEYRITTKGLCSNSNLKESSLLCRVFKLGGAEIAGGNQFHPKPSVVPDAGSTNGQGCTSESQARNSDDNAGPLAAAGGLLNIPVENMPDIDYILRGDYLELDDLADPESRSSSSDNTSCLTLASDECFDSLALMRDLEEEINRGERGKDANFKFSIAASVGPNEVVMRPATLGSLISGNGSKSPAKAVDKKFLDKKVPENAIKSQKVDNRNEGTTNSTSSSSHKTVPKGEKKAPVVMLKKKVPENAIKSQKVDNRNERTTNSTPSSSHKTVPEAEKKAPVVMLKKKLKQYLCFT